MKFTYTDSNGRKYDIVYITLEDIPDMDPHYWGEWYDEVKRVVATLYWEKFVNPPICMSCGQTVTRFDLHHGIVTRQDVRGWRVRTRGANHRETRLILITNPLNCIPLHHKCHMISPPTREEVWRRQCGIFGKDHLLDWYNKLPWKYGPPRRFE